MKEVVDEIRACRALRAFRPGGVTYRDEREAGTGAGSGTGVGILIYDPGGAAPGRLPMLRLAFGARSSGSSCVMLRSAEGATGPRVPHSVRGSARRSVPDGTSSLASQAASADGGLARREAVNGRRGRSELAALYLRVADTLERSAQLAEEHARRERRTGGATRRLSSWTAPGAHAKPRAADARSLRV